MQVLEIKTQTSKYPIYIGEQVLSQLNQHLEKASQVMVITDETVDDLYHEHLKSYLPKATPFYRLKPGEKSKSFSSYYEVQSFLIEHQMDRRGLILAFGGGVVGDLAGFVAATYMRGIDFIQIPTTLLAHDSAIGGKVAINHEQGKNLIGAFYPPKAVVYELPFLSTLSPKEWRSGLGEMIKHGFIQDTDLLACLMQQHALDELITANFSSLLVQSLEVKRKIVQEDEFEKGRRAFLNFGHTFGHAVELIHTELSHGEAVAIGMVFALYVSQSELGLSYDLSALLTYLKAWEYPFPLDLKYLEQYLNYMDHDKKNVNQLIRFVLLEQLERPILKGLSKEQTKAYILTFLTFLSEWRESQCI